MKKAHDKAQRPARKVAEPVQVYLDSADQDRLERLTDQLGSTKSAVMRQALQALENQLTSPENHPALRIIGIAPDAASARDPYDIAREHDRYLADVEDKRASAPKGKKKHGG